MPTQNQDWSKPLTEVFQDLKSPTWDELKKSEQPIPIAENLSFGQRLAGVSFNPSKDEIVDKVKNMFAELADIVQKQGDPNSDYLFNLIKGNALREILNAQMNTVKLLTLKY
jgi:hypothetical protein